MSESTSSSTRPEQFLQHATQAELVGMNDTTRGIVISLGTVGTETGDALRELITDLLSPEVLLNKGTAQFPSLWPDIRKFLVGRGTTLRVHNCHHAIYTIANTISASEEENQTATELARCVITGTIYQENTSAAVTRDSSRNEHQTNSNAEKMSHNVAMRLNDAQ